jgi:hemerythrin-like domain-containing protein
MIMVGIQIGAKPDAGFDNPIGMLKDCHRRIESFLRVLCIVAERPKNASLSEEETAAVTSALNYFRSGGRRHTADEEQSLFPRMRAGSGNALEDLDRLEGDHQRAEELHDRIEKLFLMWIDAGWLDNQDSDALVRATSELDHIYKEHIKVEEEVVFPEASKTLDNEEVLAMGHEFRARRSSEV